MAPPREVAALTRFPARPETTGQPAALEAVLAEPERHQQPPTRSDSPPQTPEATLHSPAYWPPQRPVTPRSTPEQRHPQATPEMTPPAPPRQTTMRDQKPSTPALTPARRNVATAWQVMLLENLTMARRRENCWPPVYRMSRRWVLWECWRSQAH